MFYFLFSLDIWKESMFKGKPVNKKTKNYFNFTVKMNHRTQEILKKKKIKIMFTFIFPILY